MMFVKSIAANFQGPYSFAQRFFKRTPYSHYFTNRFHVSGKGLACIREFFKVEFWNFNYTIIYRRFKRCRCIARDIIWYLIKRITHCQFSSDLCYRETCGLGGQCGTSRYPWIHFYYNQFSIGGIYRELDIRPACFNPDLTNNLDCRISHYLIFFVS